MTRTFRPFDLVQLPNLDAAGAQTLGAEVIAVATGKTLPPPIAEALADLTAAHQALKKAAEQRLPSADAGNPASQAADMALDAAWSSLFTLLRGWSKLPDHSHADVAATLLGQVFPDKLRFTQLPFKLEWAESDTRLRTIDSRGLAKDLETLGATPALIQLRKLHAQYGEVLDITTPSNPQPAANIRDALEVFRDSLRVYVVRVAASERQQDPSSADLALELVAPIERWEVTHAATAAPEAAPPPPPTPTPAAEPPVAALVTTPAR